MEAQISHNISVSQNQVHSNALTLCHLLEPESEVRTLLDAHLWQNSWFLLCIEKSLLYNKSANQQTLLMLQLQQVEQEI